MMRWVQMQQIPAGRIEVSSRGEPAQSVVEKPYYIQQTSGSALGYLVVPFDPEGAHRGLDPSLRAYRIPLDRDIRRLDLQITDRAGKPVPGGARRIRIIAPSRWSWLLLVIACTPCVAFAVVRFQRLRRLGRTGR